MKSIARTENWKSLPSDWDLLNLEYLFEADPDSPDGIPMLAPCLDVPTSLIPFNTASAELDRIGPEKKTALHFFLDDYRFERVWRNPIKYSKYPVNMGIVLTPDFSIWSDMPRAIKAYQVYRNRWMGAFWQSLGVKVIPTISWTNPIEDLYFAGLPMHSTIAVSSVGVKQHDDKYFIQGIEEIQRRLEPKNIVCYGPIHKHRMIFGIKATIFEFDTRWDIIKPKGSK